MNSNLEQKYSFEEMRVIAHSLGINLHKAIISHKKIDKSLPIKFYRNYYQSAFIKTFDQLIVKDYAYEWTDRDELHYYTITTKGIEKFIVEFQQLVNYQPVRHRGLQYVQQRMTNYCNFYNYRYGDNPSKHIINAYVNDFVKGYIVSHTTKDCIQTFLPELKKLHKLKLI